MPLDEQQLRLPGCGILYDASRLRKPAPEMFTAEYWIERGSHQELAGGRASVSFIQTGTQRWVLRHYRRGGLMAKLLRDEYFWWGAHRTRCFAEWRLLAELIRLGLPVPAPVAARYVRTGWFYRADLITEELPRSLTLAKAISTPGAAPAKSRWCAVGETIARFHAHGVHHADLNANNILLGEQDSAVYVLDFDRGRIRTRGAWEEQVLARLKRSLAKIQAAQPAAVFGDPQWCWFLEGYGIGAG